MSIRHYARLCAIARRESRDTSSAEDLVQDALLAAILAGRSDIELPENLAWIIGVIRNRARMAARSAARRHRREGQWLATSALAANATSLEPRPELTAFLPLLPPALRSLAVLALSGHNRREIAYLLALSDAALRQRVADLKRRIVKAGLAAPADMPGLGMDLAYGRIREALLPLLRQQDGVLASHDPDGHLFVISRSQKPGPRQHAVQLPRESSS